MKWLRSVILALWEAEWGGSLGPRHLSPAWAMFQNSVSVSFFFFKTGSHHVAQAGLELLTSGDPPALTSKVLGLQA